MHFSAFSVVGSRMLFSIISCMIFPFLDSSCWALSLSIASLILNPPPMILLFLPFCFIWFSSLSYISLSPFHFIFHFSVGHRTLQCLYSLVCILVLSMWFPQFLHMSCFVAEKYSSFSSLFFLFLPIHLYTFLFFVFVIFDSDMEAI